MIRRTDSDQYPSGWRYALHFGSLEPDHSRFPTLPDGPIRRYDNAHEDAKGHELHTAPDPDPTIIDFPGMLSLYKRFWGEIPKNRVGLEES